MARISKGQYENLIQREDHGNFVCELRRSEYIKVGDINIFPHRVSGDRMWVLINAPRAVKIDRLKVEGND